MQYYLAIDIGASSGRHVLGWIEDGKLRLEEVYRFENGLQKRDGHLIWDTQRLFAEILTGMKRCREGEILLLNQNAAHEILPAGMNDVAVNFLILPEFFTQAIHMVDESDVLFRFFTQTLAAENGISGHLHFHVRDILPVQNLIENLIWNLLHKNQPFHTINQISMGLLFLHLADHADTIERESPDGLTPVLVFSALKYIKANYKDGTLEAFCETVHQKAYTISRLIKQHTSHTFKELLMEQKLSQAAYLLAKTDLPTESIFHSVGYENSSFFYRKFKEAYGMSPREYRAAKQSERSEF
jgi:AraC-like DNA-binding protein